MSAPEAQHESLFEKWQGWLEIITDDLVRMYANRAVWREIVGMLEAKEAIPNRFWIRNWITEQYAAAQAAGIRRQSEIGDQVVSIGAVLEAIRRNPMVLTRERYLAVCQPDDEYVEKSVNATFDQWAGPNGEHVDPGILLAKQQVLKERAEKVTNYVDGRIAHLDREDPEPFTYFELNAALDHLGDALKELELLLRCKSLRSVEPAFQTPWRRAFVMPWLPDDEVDTWARFTADRTNDAGE